MPATFVASLDWVVVLGDGLSYLGRLEAVIGLFSGSEFPPDEALLGCVRFLYYYSFLFFEFMPNIDVGLSSVGWQKNEWMGGSYRIYRGYSKQASFGQSMPQSKFFAVRLTAWTNHIQSYNHYDWQPPFLPPYPFHLFNQQKVNRFVSHLQITSSFLNITHHSIISINKVRKPTINLFINR